MSNSLRTEVWRFRLTLKTLETFFLKITILTRSQHVFMFLKAHNDENVTFFKMFKLNFQKTGFKKFFDVIFNKIIFILHIS